MHLYAIKCIKYGIPIFQKIYAKKKIIVNINSKNVYHLLNVYLKLLYY
jgi:hypothetical protein